MRVDDELKPEILSVMLPYRSLAGAFHPRPMYLGLSLLCADLLSEAIHYPVRRSK